ncbi:MAG: DMT family transporter [Pseudomonadota bacterium]
MPEAEAINASPAPKAPTGRTMDGASWTLLVLLSVLWGSSFVFVEIILTALPVVTLVALRVLIAALTLWLVVGVLRVPVPGSTAIWASFVVLGLFNNAIPFSLIVWGQTEITAGLAAILNATTPLFTALIAGAALADERLTATKLLGIGLGIAGVAVMIGPQTILTLGDDLFHQLAVLGAALSYGIAAVFGRRFGRAGIKPIVVAAGQTSASACIMVPLALLIDGAAFLGTDSALVWLAVVANACLSTGLAYILYFTVLGRAGATNVALVTVLVPVVAVLMGALLLSEAIGVMQLVGMALIFAGLAVMDGRLLDRLRPRPGKRFHRS